MVVVLDKFNHPHEIKNDNIAIKMSDMPKCKFVESDQCSTILLDFDGFAWCWGVNDNGELGGLYEPDVLEPTKLNNIDQLRYVSVGIEHTFFITNNGDLIGFGSNSNFQLGIDSHYFKQYEPVILRDLPKFRSVSCGSIFTLALDVDNNVWIFGSILLGAPENLRSKIQHLPEILSIHAGNDHAILIDCFHKAWSFGSNMSGELGLGDLENRQYPALIDSINDVAAAGCMYAITVLIRLDGSVWVCGDNNFGRLGLETYNTITIPTLLPDMPPIVSVKCTRPNLILFVDIYNNVWIRKKSNTRKIINSDGSTFEHQDVRRECESRSRYMMTKNAQKL